MIKEPIKFNSANPCYSGTILPRVVPNTLFSHIEVLLVVMFSGSTLLGKASCFGVSGCSDAD